MIPGGDFSPERDELRRDQKFASDKYLQRQLEKQITRLEGRVPADEIDQKLIFTPSPAAKKNPRLEQYERTQWRSMVREYKHAKLGAQLLGEVDAEIDIDIGSLPDQPPQSTDSGGSGRGEENLGRDAKDQVTGAQNQANSSGTKRQGGGDNIASGKSHEGESARSADSGAPSSIGTVKLGTPPPAGQSAGPSPFDQFIARTGIGVDTPPRIGRIRGLSFFRLALVRKVEPVLPRGPRAETGA